MFKSSKSLLLYYYVQKYSKQNPQKYFIQIEDIV